MQLVHDNGHQSVHTQSDRLESLHICSLCSPIISPTWWPHPQAHPHSIGYILPWMEWLAPPHITYHNLDSFLGKSFSAVCRLTTSCYNFCIILLQLLRWRKHSIHSMHGSWTSTCNIIGELWWEHVKRVKSQASLLTLMNCAIVACAGLLMIRNFRPLYSIGEGAPGPVFRAMVNK